MSTAVSVPPVPRGPIAVDGGLIFDDMADETWVDRVVKPEAMLGR